MANWKKVKITSIRSHKGFMVFELDNSVLWGNRENPSINNCYPETSFSVFDCYPFNTWQIDDYIEVNLDKSVNCRWADPINDTSVARKVSSSNEIVSRNNNNLSLINQNQSGVAIQMVNRAIDSDERNRYTASMEVNPKTGNITYHLSGERK